MKTQHLIILTALLGLSALSLHRHRQSHPMTGGDATASCCTLAEKEAPRPTLVVPEDFKAELPPTAAAQWQKPSSLPPMAAFQKWADDFTAQPAAEKIEAGVKAATERRAELRRLIQENPELALASAVPETVRRAMPEEVRALLEQKVDARGDLLVTAVSYSDGKLPEGERAVSTRAKLSDGRKFDAFTYGRREDQPTRLGVPVHGIALDGKLAVSEWPGRVLEPIELKEAKMLAGDGTLCVVSEKPTAAAVTETAVIVERKTQFYCGPSHAAEDLLAASVLETDGDDTQSHQIAASGGEGGTVPGFQPSNPAWTTGTKRMLVVRVSFRLPLPEVGTADYAFLSTTDCEEIVRRIGQSYTAWSYGKYTVAPVQAGGSAVTKAVRLTYQANHYTGDDIYDIWDEVEAALPDLGYDRADYPLLLVLAGNAPFTDPKDATKTVGWGGIGLIGGGKSLIRMNGDGWTNEERLEANHQVSLHEIGHNFGLWHSSNIKPNQVIDPLQPQGAFSTGEEYGDFYDRMGSSSHAFNVRFKQWLGWLPAASVPRATGTGVFTLREHDLEEATGVRGISFPLGDPPINKPRYDLYAEYRLKTLKSLSGVPYVRYEDPLLAYGAVIHVAKLGTAKTWIVDATPETPNDGPLIPGTEDRDWKGNFDAPLLPGRTMSFTRDDLTTYVTNLSADPEAGQLRLEVRHGSDEEIKAPVGQITKSSVTIAQGEKITLTADATDADDTDLAYFWQIPRFDYSNMQPAVFANSRDISVQFPQLGVYDVSCIVSDKHGGTVKLLTSFMVTENSAPTISAIGTHSMDEDTTLTVPFTVGDVSTPASSLTMAYSYTASDPLLFNFLSFQFTGTGANRALNITPVANHHGSATIRVKVSDGGKTTTEEFDLIVNPTTPGTTLLASGSTGWHYRASSLPPVGDWKSSTYDDSTWTVSNARFSYPGPFGNFGGWTILPNVAGRVTCFFRKTFTMPALPNGAAMIRLLCDDGAVVYVNGTEVYRHNMPSGIIYPTTPALTSLEGFLENVRTVIPVNPSLLINGGTNLIAVEVHDSNGVRNGSSGDVEFDLEFGLSLAPVVNTISDQTVLEDTAAGPYEFTASDFEAGGGPLNFRISSSDQSIIHETHAFVSATGTPGHYSLFMTPEPNATGSTQITLKVSDGQTETWRTFNLHVMPVNDAPSMDVIDSLVVAESLPQFHRIRVTDIDTAPELLRFDASSSNTEMLPASGIEILDDPDDTIRWLRITPKQGSSGQTSITVSVEDEHGETASRTFIFSITSPLPPGSSDITLIEPGNTWRYFAFDLPLDKEGNPVDFTAPDFDDSKWPIRAAEFRRGKNGSGSIGDNPYRIATYFRTQFEVGLPASISLLKLRLMRDDGAAVYLNGTRVWTSNLPQYIGPETVALSDVDGDFETQWHTLDITPELLVQGTNTVAVELRQSVKPTTLAETDFAFDFTMTAVPTAAANPPTFGNIIPPGAEWAYWDQHANSGNAAWRNAAADDSSWARGMAPLGYGHGTESTVVNRYNGAFTNKSVLFRKYFDIADPDAYTTLHLFMQRDDGAVVYLNGTRIIIDNVSNTVTSSDPNPQPEDYAASPIAANGHNIWRHYSVDPRLLISGQNFIAISVHQSPVTESALYFDLQLSGELSPMPNLKADVISGNMRLRWSAAYTGWQLQKSTDLKNWFPAAIQPAVEGSNLKYSEPLSGDRCFYRLVAP